MINVFQRHKEREDRLKKLAEKPLAELYGLASELEIDAESLLRILAGVQGIDPALGDRIDELFNIKFPPKPRPPIEVPKPPIPIEIIPERCSVFKYMDEMWGIKDPYKIPNHKDLLTELIDESEYDGALGRVRSGINRILEKFFKGELHVEEAVSISYGTTSECPESRRYELEILDKDTEALLYGLIYQEGRVLSTVGNVPEAAISSILKREGAWE